VLRALSGRGLADWEALAASELFRRATGAGSLVATERVDDGVPDELAGEGWAAILAHERIPFVSYPYEWPFGMLRDAALLQLELLRGALAEDLVLKDATPYNVQWRGTRPVFVDVGSFERLRGGEPWAGYRQFCMLSLYPLLLQAFRKVPFQPWLRGSLEGITPEECRRLLSVRDRLRRGVLGHVVLHSRLERRYADRRRDVKGELRAAGFHKGLIEANARGLEKLVRRLSWEPERVGWARYGEEAPYSDADTAAKETFVREAAGRRRSRLVWDLGANDGRFTRLAAANADYTVAVDADPAVVELLYRTLGREQVDGVLPLVIDLADPSPGLGWRGRERAPLEERGRPDLVLCLALVHHLAISSNVPPASFLAWLATLGAEIVLELPTRDDPMVQRLLAAKAPGANPDYDDAVFEQSLEQMFRVERREQLPSGTRILYRAAPRA
jgi:SAM-dependent methyltransferase